jgi:hypothetical protein
VLAAALRRPDAADVHGAGRCRRRWYRRIDHLRYGMPGALRDRGPLSQRRAAGRQPGRDDELRRLGWRLQRHGECSITVVEDTGSDRTSMHTDTHNRVESDPYEASSAGGLLRIVSSSDRTNIYSGPSSAVLRSERAWWGVVLRRGSRSGLAVAPTITCVPVELTNGQWWRRATSCQPSSRACADRRRLRARA